MSFSDDLHHLSHHNSILPECCDVDEVLVRSERSAHSLGSFPDVLPILSDDFSVFGFSLPDLLDFLFGFLFYTFGIIPKTTFLKLIPKSHTNNFYSILTQFSEIHKLALIFKDTLSKNQKSTKFTYRGRTACCAPTFRTESSGFFAEADAPGDFSSACLSDGQSSSGDRVR